MSEVASRWALVASLALHAGVLALAVRTPREAPPAHWLTDFWGGKTFEVPDRTSDEGEGETPSSEDESANEVDVDGLDTSANPSARPTPPAATEGLAPAPPPTRPRPSSRGSAPSSAPAASHGSGPGGTFGAEGSAAGVRDLVGSFARTVPIIASADPVWATLPLGAAGSADVTLVLDEDGKPHVSGTLAAPSHLRRLVLKTISVMSGGRFGIVVSDGMVPRQKVHIALTLTQQAAPSQDQVSSGGVFGLRSEPPDPHNVRHAFFTLASGRQVEIAIRPLTH